MKVLLIPPKNNYPDPRPRIDVIGQGFPYIAGVLQQAGHEVFAINLGYRWCQEAASVELQKSIRQALTEHHPDLIGVGGQSADYGFIRDAIRCMRESAPQTPVVCGGDIITYDREHIFNALRPDYAIWGDAEDAIVALADCLQNGGDLDMISNLAYWKAGQAVFNPLQFSGGGIDDIPWPSYEPFDFETYLLGLNQADHFFAHTRQNPRILPITLGRSYPYLGTFCCHITNSKYRERSIDNAIQEIRYFYHKYHFNILFVCDDLFSARRERTSEFCAKVKSLRSEGLDFDWTVDLRVPNVDPEMLREMKDAGCIFIGYGLESASPTVLQSMKTGIKVEQIQRAIEMTTAVGIGVQGGFIFGDFAETTETLAETMTFFSRYCRDLIVHLGLLTPYPGSETFSRCLDEGLIKDRQQYYETVDATGAYRINMSKIPDDCFYERTGRIAHLTVASAHDQLGLKEAELFYSEPIYAYEFDLQAGAPERERRWVYDVQVICPHCQTSAEYLFPIPVYQLTDSMVQRAYCPECHKRFNITIPIQPPEDKQEISPRLSDLLEERKFNFCMEHELPYFGKHMGALQGSPERHVYMDLLVKKYTESSSEEPLRILEIGSWAGGSAITWANAIKSYVPEKGMVLCIDPWKPYFESHNFSQLGGQNSVHYREMEIALRKDEILKLFTHNICTAHMDDIVFSMRGSSDQMLPLLMQEGFDIIFVDGDHSYPCVLKDLKNAARLLRNGGVLCGDDLELQSAQIDLQYAWQMVEKDFVLDPRNQEYYHPGVTLAVAEFFGQVSARAGFWYMRKVGEGWEELDLSAIPTSELQLPLHFRCPSGFAMEPVLATQNHLGYNVVQYGDLFIGLSISLGHINVPQLDEMILEQHKQAGLVVSETSLEEAKTAIENLKGSETEDRSLPVSSQSREIDDIGDYRRYYFTRFSEGMMGIETSISEDRLSTLGPEELRSYLSAGRIFIGQTVDEIKHWIDQMDKGKGVVRLDLSQLHSPLNSHWRILLVHEGAVPYIKNILDQLPFKEIDLLTPRSQKYAWQGRFLIPYVDASSNEAERINPYQLPENYTNWLKARAYDLVVVPYEPRLGIVPWERFVSSFCSRMLIIFPDGQARLYVGDDIQRNIYNMAYLRTMLKLTPDYSGASILEIGCSDGLTCDLLAKEHPRRIIGVDYWSGTLRFQDSRFSFVKSDAHHLAFPNRSFDLVYSIATLEHCRQPFDVLQEMRRLLKPGGYGYVQAGPLYYSPFGHHMFGYFDDVPWIHLRMTKEQILAHCQQKKLDKKIKQSTGLSSKEYLDGMLNFQHINGKKLKEYELERFSNQPGIELLGYWPSHEGQDLLTPEILKEVSPLAPEDLVAHGFEMLFKRTV